MVLTTVAMVSANLSEAVITANIVLYITIVVLNSIFVVLTIIRVTIARKAPQQVKRYHVPRGHIWIKLVVNLLTAA